MNHVKVTDGTFRKHMLREQLVLDVLIEISIFGFVRNVFWKMISVKSFDFLHIVSCTCVI